MPTTVKENYLKAIYFIDEEEGRISVTELSKRLEVSKPTASSMMKSLEEQGWVVYQKYKPLQLTEKGRKAAAKIIRKHRLTEMFLYEVMGFGWEEVHEIAEQMEHIQSEKLFARMDEILNYPTVDPHGSPIPDEKGNISKPEYVPLTSMADGQRVQLCALAHSSEDLLRYLNELNIHLGTVIHILKTEPFDKSILMSGDEKAPILISEKV
ncbi:MAG: metal-dependent transcriptional regulator, partial [Bacteroidota bacterium]